MKILLLGFNVQEDIFPLGLSYLKGYVKNKVDADIEIKEFSFGNRFSYDINSVIEQRVMSYILMTKPDMVGFAGYIWSAAVMKNIARAIKSINPSIKLIIGGCEADKESVEDFDFVMYGEGEIAFLELIEYLENKRELENVSNIIYKNNDNVITNKEKFVEDLDTIPFPYLQKFKYKYPVIKIETARGCVFNCKYCNYATRKKREFSIDYLKKNIPYIFDNYDFKHMTILDANFNANKKRLKAILDIIEKHKTQTKLTVNMELKPELIDEELVSILESYSFDIRAELGLQSTDKEVLEECKRPYDLEKVKDALTLLDRSKIKYKIDLMYGLPKDNFFKFLKSADFILSNSKKQKKIIAHHYMLLNNTDFMKSNVIRFDKKASSMVVKTDTQDIIDLYKTKLFIDLINTTSS